MPKIKLMPTGVPNLDAVLGGGFPIYSLNMLAGAPGTGKTILVQQILFNTIKHQPQKRALYLSTLSEPTLKVVRYMQHFQFFDAQVFGEQVIYSDIGSFLIEQPMPRLADHIVGLVNQHQAEVIVIDSFKAIAELTEKSGDFRRFCYELSVRLASARCTTFLVNESEPSEINHSPEFALADGIIYLSTHEEAGEQRRWLQVHKLRGLAPYMEPFPFVITNLGVRILSPTLTLRQKSVSWSVPAGRMVMGIPGLDQLLRGGIPYGRSIILSGVAGTGKTTFALQFLMAGVDRGEKGLLFSFEETPSHLSQMAAGFGWDLERLIQQEMLRIVFVTQTNIRVEEHLDQIAQEIASFQPQRFVVDSLSVLFYKVNNRAIQREKTFQLATLMQQIGGVGIFISGIPAHETGHLSSFGVEETIVDGMIMLSKELVGRRRDRYLEVFKMRASDHVCGYHRMAITENGIEILYSASQISPPSTTESLKFIEDAPYLVFRSLEKLLPGKIPYNTACLVEGAPGLGKSTLAYQFLLCGLHRQESVLYISADIPRQQVYQTLPSWGLLPDPYLEAGQLVILDTFSPIVDTLPATSVHLNLNDPEMLLLRIAQQLEQMPKPCRVIFDSLTPLLINCTPREFIKLVYRKNRQLRQPDVAVLDIFAQDGIEKSDRYNLLNLYDLVVDLYSPDWDEMNNAADIGYKNWLRITKIRGAKADQRPYPYSISPTKGIVIESTSSQSKIIDHLA